MTRPTMARDVVGIARIDEHGRDTWLMGHNMGSMVQGVTSHDQERFS